MKRIPQNPEAEICLLGSYLLDPIKAFELVPDLNPEWFYGEPYRLIAKAIVEINAKGETVDYVAIIEHLKRCGISTADLGIDRLLAGLLDAVPGVTNTAFYAKAARESAKRRDVIRLCTDVVNLAYSEEVELDKIVESLSQSAASAISDESSANTHDAQSLTTGFWERIDERQKRKGGLVGVGTGIRSIDYSLSGLRPGNLIIVAGRPAMGKTALITSIAPRIAAREAVEGSVDDGEVVVFSLEMTREQMIDRIICSMAKVDMIKLEQGLVTAEDYERLKRASDIIYWSRLTVDDTPDLSAAQMIGIVRRIAARKKLCAIFVDYLQIISPPAGKERDNERIIVGANATMMKLMARLFRVPVVCLSQINRGVESREDKRPELSDLAESGKIEAVADSVLFPFRPQYYDRSNSYKDFSLAEEAEIIIAKNRFGPTGAVPILFTPAYTRFDSKKEGYVNVTELINSDHPERP